MKYFILSIDDGTIYDKKVIDILNRHHIKGTFNLNSGLDDYVWYQDDKPVRRNTLKDCVDIYNGHEIASHSLTHPHLTMCDNDRIGYEVGVDKENLERIFKRPIFTFAFPFFDFDDRCINRIKEIYGIQAIRVSEFDKSFKFPVDQFHIKITSLDVKEAVTLFKDFINDDEAELFVFVSHGYDFEFYDTYDDLDKLCEMVSNSNVKSIYTSELADLLH